jgi:hypothetical protein
MLPWYVTSVEVNLWTALGLPHGSRRWEMDGADFESIAHEVAQFITDGEVATGGTVLARRSTDPQPRRRPLLSFRSLAESPSRKKP